MAGRYDKDAEEVILKYPALDAVLLIALSLDPEQGGFSLTMRDPGLQNFVVAVLRQVADNIEKETHIETRKIK